jgi:hypothetical protein
MINDKPFERWFEQREPNGMMRCDNIYDVVAGLHTQEEIYDFVESMMLVAWSAAIDQKITAKDI